MSRRDGRRRVARAHGFTLIEIMVTLAILGVGVFVLLEAHYGALRLFDDTQDEVLIRQFLQRAVAEAELAVVSGTLSGEEEFGERWEGYRYTFDATPVHELEGIKEFDVFVTLITPGEEKTLSFLVYDMGAPGEGSDSADNLSNSTRNNVTGSGGSRRNTSSRGGSAGRARGGTGPR